MAEMVYLQLAESVLAEKRKVLIRDVSKVVSDNLDLKNKIEKIELMNFSTSSKEQQVISILDIIEEIRKNCDGELCIQNLGQPDVVVYYKAFDPSDRIKQKFKFIFLCLIAFFGAGFSIISYNSDVNLVGQLDLLQNVFTGGSESGAMIGGVAYSLGLFIGIIVFFNHIGGRRITKDPTPIEVEMRIYETDVNTALIETSDRQGDTIDV